MRELPRVLMIASLAFALLGGCKGEAKPAEAAPSPQATAPSASERPAERSLEPGPPLREDGTLYAESELMGTRVSINVYVGDPAQSAAAAQAMREAFAEIARIEAIASEWQADSDLSRLNAAAGGDAVEVPPELFEILERAAEISARSEGKFDISFHAVGELWKFGPGAKPPSPEDVAARLPLVNWRAVELDAAHRRVRLRTPGMKLGLGAIAKGYAVDAASRILRDAGHANHVVEGGGDTFASGSKDGQPWRVGVQDPNAAGALGFVSLENMAVVTSGNYMRFFEWEGRRYTHIIDPTTGFPIPEGQSPKSVTCVAPDATAADAWCTALTVMGREAALRMVETQPQLELLLIDHDDSVHLSSGFIELWTPLGPPAEN